MDIVGLDNGITIDMVSEEHIHEWSTHESSVLLLTWCVAYNTVDI